jgi:hypothetical protein
MFGEPDYIYPTFPWYFASYTENPTVMTTAGRGPRGSLRSPARSYRAAPVNGDRAYAESRKAGAPAAERAQLGKTPDKGVVRVATAK